MLFFRKRGSRSVATSAMLACLAFIAAAIWAWDLPVADALKFLLISLGLIFTLMLGAFLTICLFKGLQKLLRR